MRMSKWQHFHFWVKIVTGFKYLIYYSTASLHRRIRTHENEWRVSGWFYPSQAPDTCSDLWWCSLIGHHISSCSTGGVTQTQILHHLRQRDPGSAVVIRLALHRDLRSICTGNNDSGVSSVRMITQEMRCECWCVSSPLKMLTFFLSISSSSRSSRNSVYCLWLPSNRQQVKSERITTDLCLIYVHTFVCIRRNRVIHSDTRRLIKHALTAAAAFGLTANHTAEKV